MKRLIIAVFIVVLSFIMLSPVLVVRNAFAIDDCTAGTTRLQDGSCGCPSGTTLQNETDGTTSCKLEPFSQVCNGAAANSSACQTDGKNPISGKDGVIFKAINIFSIIIGIASVIMILIGGLKYVISRGDSNSISSAKNTILYAVIGIVVFLLSRGIITFVINKL